MREGDAMDQPRYRADLDVRTLTGPDPTLQLRVIKVDDEGKPNYSASSFWFRSLDELEEMINCLQSAKRRWVRTARALVDQ